MKRRTGLVYYVQEGSTGPIKIGFTRRPITERLSQIRPTSPIPLRLLLTRAGTRHDERMDHARFASLRLRGEWFKPDAMLLAYIMAHRNDPWLAPDKKRLGLQRQDGLEYAALPGCRPGPQIASTTMPDKHRIRLASPLLNDGYARTRAAPEEDEPMPLRAAERIGRNDP